MFEQPHHKYPRTVLEIAMLRQKLSTKAKKKTSRLAQLREPEPETTLKLTVLRKNPQINIVLAWYIGT